MLYFLIGLFLSVCSPATAGLPFKYVKFQNLSHITIAPDLTATIKYNQNNSHFYSNYYFNDSISYGYTYLTKTKTSSIQTHINQNIQIVFSKVVSGFAVLLYCFNWPSGTYTFENFASIPSQNDNKAGSVANRNGTSILTISNGKEFNGILEFQLYAHIKTLQWTGPSQQGKNLIFGVGILYPVTCTLPSVDHSLIVQGTCTGKYNSQCIYTCRSGYKPATYLSNHCIANGTYQFTLKNKLPSACISTTCNSEPTHVSGITTTTCSGTACGSTCNVPCGSDYTGTVHYACTTAGTWGTATGSCSANCLSPPTPVLGISKDRVADCLGPSGFGCGVECGDGYTGTVMFLCTAGTWGSTGACSPNTCNSEPTHVTGITTTTCSGKKATCDVPCDSGYTGTVSYTCTTAGTWVTATGSCSANPCNDPSQLIPGLSQTDSCSQVPSGQGCGVQCDATGYDGGAIDWICTAGTWGPPIGFCQAEDCWSEPTLIAGLTSTDCSGTSSGDNCIAVCENGSTVSFLCTTGTWGSASGPCGP